jgi:hypothetical protein
VLGTRRREPVARIPEERSALVVVLGRTPGGNEPENLTRLELRSLGGVPDLVLRFVREPGERERDRGPDRPVGELQARLARESRGERVALLDPARALLEHASCRAPRELVVLEERADDLGLVTRTDGARRRIRLEQESLELGVGRGRVHNDGNARPALRAPALEPLEAVDHLEVVLARDDPDRKVREGRASPDRRASAPERLEARAQALDRDEDDGSLGGGRPYGSSGHFSGSDQNEARAGPLPRGLCAATRRRGRP